jgi:polyhydroxybutyrate depolymerase
MRYLCDVRAWFACCLVMIMAAGCGAGGSGSDGSGVANANTTPGLSSSSSGSSSSSSSSSGSSSSSSSGGSTGCGTAAQFSDGKYTLVSDGTSREFWVSLPATYNKSQTYPLVVALHWSGGQATDVYNGNSWASQKPFFGLKALYGDSAVFVAPNGLDSGWANTNSRDIHFIQAMVDQLKQGLCIDSQHVYATGFSFGGMMSNAIGCQMGDTFRAVAPMSGSLWSGCVDASNKVAAILFHSQADAVVAYKYGEEARDKYLSKNSCSATTTSLGSNGCVEYQGCNSKYPVVWCGYADGGHWPPTFSAQETKNFFDRF